MVVIWGDSHAAALYPGLKEFQQTHAFGITQWTRAHCPPLVDSRSALSGCDEVNEQILRNLVKIQPEVLILHAKWLCESGYPHTPEEIISKTSQRLSELKGMLPRTKLVVIGPMPHWNPSLPLLLQEYHATHRTPPPLYIPRVQEQDLLARKPVETGLQKACLELGAYYISPERIFCEGVACRARLDDVSAASLFVWDSDHLTPLGSSFFVSRIGDQLLP